MITRRRGVPQSVRGIVEVAGPDVDDAQVVQRRGDAAVAVPQPLHEGGQDRLELPQGPLHLAALCRRGKKKGNEQK